MSDEHFTKAEATGLVRTRVEAAYDFPSVPSGTGGTVKRIKEVDFGVATGQGFGSMDWAVFRVSNRGGRTVTWTGIGTEVRTENGWERAPLHTAPRGELELGPGQSIEVLVQAMDGGETRRAIVQYHVPASLYERLFMRLRDAWRSGSLVNLRRPVFRGLSETVTYRMEGSNVVEIVDLHE